MDRKTKNLQNKLNVRLQQKNAEIKLREDEIEVYETMKGLSEKAGEKTDHYDNNISEKKEIIKELRQHVKDVEDELKKLK